MDWALQGVIKQYLEEYLDGLDMNFENTRCTSNSPMTLRHVRLKAEKIKRDVLKEGQPGSPPFEFQSGTIGSIEFRMSWLGHLQVYATDIMLNLELNHMKAISQSLATSAKPKIIDAQHHIDVAQPRFCTEHIPVNRRRKVAEHWTQCSTCQIRLQTNYADLCLCPICSEREFRCMLCGSFAPSQTSGSTTAGTNAEVPPPMTPKTTGGLSTGGSGPHSTPRAPSPVPPSTDYRQKSLFGWNSSLASASSLLSSVLKKPSGDNSSATELSTPSNSSFHMQQGQAPANGWRSQFGQIPVSRRQDSPDYAADMANVKEASPSKPMKTPARSGAASSSGPSRNARGRAATAFPSHAPTVLTTNATPAHGSRDPQMGDALRTPIVAAPHHSATMDQMSRSSQQHEIAQPTFQQQERSMPTRALTEPFIQTPRNDEVPRQQQWMRDAPPTPDHHRQHEQPNIAHSSHDSRKVADHPDTRMHHGRHDLSIGQGHQHDVVIPDDGNNRLHQNTYVPQASYQFAAVASDASIRTPQMPQAEFSERSITTPQMPQEASGTASITASGSNSSVYWRMNSEGEDRVSVVDPKSRSRMSIEDPGTRPQYGQDYSFTATSQGAKDLGGAKKHNPFALDNHW